MLKVILIVWQNWQNLTAFQSSCKSHDWKENNETERKKMKLKVESLQNTVIVNFTEIAIIAH